MSEITMPAELMAAVNVFGGQGAISPVSAEEGSQNGSFGNILGLLMADAAQVQVQAVPGMTEDAVPPEMTVCDILAAALAGDENAVLPEIFTEKGAGAFIETLSRFLRDGEGNISPEKLASIWEKVSPEERSAFAELLYAVSDISEGDVTETQAEPADILSAVAKLSFKTLNKPRKDDDEDFSDKDILISGMTGVIIPAEVRSESNVSDDAVLSAQTASISDTSDLIPAEIPETPARSTETIETADMPDMKVIADKLQQADPEELVKFCKALAKELNASVTVSDTAPESSETDHITYGRQNMQGIMSRVSKTYDEDIPADAVIPRSALTEAPETAPLPENISVSDGEELSSQIMRQIDLYRDIFSDNFSEREIEMKLSPESLGGLEISIKRTDGGFEVRFTAEKAEAAELIREKSSELAEAIASRGIALKEISVSRQIVANESDGSLTGGSDLYSGTGEHSSPDRHFSFDGNSHHEGSSELTDESDTENIINREAKLWVSA